MADTQASMAVSAITSSNLVERPPSPIASTHMAVPATQTLNAYSASGPQNSNPGPSRTEELILAELQRLSARMSNVEHELQADTFTSTPRKRKKQRTGAQKGENSVMGRSVNVTGNNSTIDESVILHRQASRVVIPVHTQQTTCTTATATSSLFTSRNPIVSQQVRIPTTYTQTQVVFSTCQTLHPGQHAPNRYAIGRDQTRLQGTLTKTTIPNQIISQTPRVVSQPIQGGLQQLGDQVVRTGQGADPTGIRSGATSYVPNLLLSQQQITNTDINNGTPDTVPGITTGEGLSQLPGPGTYRYTGAIGGLPTSQQAQEHHLIPSMQALRTTAVNQDLVQRRLQELQQQATPQTTGISSNITSQTHNTGASSSKKGKKEKIDVVWPQDCAFVGHLRARVSYEQLTQAQFTLGFLRSVQEEGNPFIRSNMVEYMTELFQNVCDFGWQAAKGAHLVVMTKMEEGLVTWSDLKKVNKIRKTYVRATGSNSSNNNSDSNNQNFKKTARKPSSMPCKDFQEGKCSKQHDHEVGLITHKHICAYCLYTLNRMYNHAENVCNNKRRAKNGQPPHPQ